MKDVGPLKYFLGIGVQHNSEGFLLSQTQYTEDLLERAGMANYNPITTPTDSKPKALAIDG